MFVFISRKFPSLGGQHATLHLLAPKAGCALKCVLWAADSTPKQHPKASSGLWSMGLEMANSVAIAADDKFIKFI